MFDEWTFINNRVSQSLLITITFDNLKGIVLPAASLTVSCFPIEVFSIEKICGSRTRYGQWQKWIGYKWNIQQKHCCKWQHCLSSGRSLDSRTSSQRTAAEAPAWSSNHPQPGGSVEGSTGPGSSSRRGHRGSSGWGSCGPAWWRCSRSAGQTCGSWQILDTGRRTGYLEKHFSKPN